MDEILRSNMQHKKIILLTLLVLTLTGASLSSAYAAPSPNPVASAQAVKNLQAEIDRRIAGLNKEAARTVTIKDSLIPSEFPAIITDIQGAIQQLEAIKTNLNSSNLQI
jgi:hypothetical protein